MGSNSKSLILFRHAKSDWEAEYSTDHQRPLAQRGINAAKAMGKLLADSGQLPDMVFCSTAVRAKQTLELASTEGGWRTKVDYTDDLYEANANSVIRFLSTIPNSIQCAMLVGHEPTWSSLAHLLIGGANIRFPTAAMSRIDFYYNDWRSVDVGCGQLRWLLQPRFFS